MSDTAILMPSDRIRVLSYGMTDSSAMTLPKPMVDGLLAEIAALRKGQIVPDDQRAAVTAEAMDAARRLFEARAEEYAEVVAARIGEARVRAERAERIVLGWQSCFWALALTLQAGVYAGALIRAVLP